MKRPCSSDRTFWRWEDRERSTSRPGAPAGGTSTADGPSRAGQVHDYEIAPPSPRTHTNLKPCQKIKGKSNKSPTRPAVRNEAAWTRVMSVFCPFAPALCAAPDDFARREPWPAGSVSLSRLPSLSFIPVVNRGCLEFTGADGRVVPSHRRGLPSPGPARGSVLDAGLSSHCACPSNVPSILPRAIWDLEELPFPSRWLVLEAWTCPLSPSTCKTAPRALSSSLSKAARGALPSCAPAWPPGATSSRGASCVPEGVLCARPPRLSPKPGPHGSV